MSASLLVVLQNLVLFLWTLILFVGTRVSPEIMTMMGMWMGYLALSLDLVALPLLGGGVCVLSRCYPDLRALARNTGVSFVLWAIPTLAWRILSGVLSEAGAVRIVTEVSPRLVSRTLTQVFDGTYMILAVAAVILSLALYGLNELMGRLQDVGLLETGRRRIYTGLAALNLVGVSLVAFTFLWIDLAGLLPLIGLFSLLLLAGGALILLVVFNHFGKKGAGFLGFVGISLTCIWLLLATDSSFARLVSVVLMVVVFTYGLRGMSQVRSMRDRAVGFTGLALMASSTFFMVFVGAGTLETSNSAAWLVLTGLSLKGPLLSLWAMSVFLSVRSAFRELASITPA